MNKIKYGLVWISFVIVELVLLFLVFSMFTTPVMGDVNETVEITTSLQVGDVIPEILNISIEDELEYITLVANGSKMVSCIAVIRDWNGEDTINTTGYTIASFYDDGVANQSDTDDNNSHYSNDSCEFNESFINYGGIGDDNYTVLANCTFEVQYYAYNSTWKCEVFANDSVQFQVAANDTITINSLLSLGVSNTLDYGTVNATNVSEENETVVSNYGNIMFNLSLYGYAIYEGDNLSMNCTLGSNQNISIDYERFNLTTSNPGDLELVEFGDNYTNLTETANVSVFDLDFRTNDSEDDAFNSTYWRIYVPEGVAGSCSGIIVMAATQSDAG